jgi:hypothetical protein
VNTRGLGKRQREALAFITRVNGWHTFAKDVRAVILSLQQRGLVEVSGDQFRVACGRFLACVLARMHNKPSFREVQS